MSSQFQRDQEIANDRSGFVTHFGYNRVTLPWFSNVNPRKTLRRAGILIPVPARNSRSARYFPPDQSSMWLWINIPQMVQ